VDVRYPQRSFLAWADRDSSDSSPIPSPPTLTILNCAVQADLLLPLAMNGIGVRRQASYSPDYDSKYSSGLGIQPSSKALLDGYNGLLETTNEKRAHQSGHSNVSHPAGAVSSVILISSTVEWEPDARLGATESQ